MNALRPGHLLRAVALAGTLAAPALADRVVLSSGGVIEGAAVRRGDRVVIRIESGEVTLPADAIARIERADSPVTRVEALRKRLPERSVPARLALADYCRDHGMRDQERDLLREVLDLDPGNAVARSRLGFVKTDAGWVTVAEANRARGLVQRDGRWMTQAELAELVAAEAAQLARGRERAADAAEELERSRRRERELAEAEERRRAEEEHRHAATATLFTPFVWSTGYGAAACPPGSPCQRRPRVAAPPAPRPYDATSLSVVKVPYRNP